MAKPKNSKAAAKAPTFPATLVKSLAEMPEAARESGLMGLVSFFTGQLYPGEKNPEKATALTRAHILNLVNEHNEAAQHEEMLKGVVIDAESILGALPETVTDILEEDSTKRFVVTLRWDSSANDNAGAYVLAKSLQTARGRKAKSDSAEEDSDAE